MAMSEPDRQAFDPKSHLSASLDGASLEKSDTFDAIAPQHSVGNAANDSTTLLNSTAHHLNAAANMRDPLVPPTNGVHSSSSPLEDTANSTSHDTNALGISNTPLTQDSQVPEKGSTPQEYPSEIPAPAVPDPIPALPQQPISDVRDHVEPATTIEDLAPASIHPAEDKPVHHAANSHILDSDDPDSSEVRNLPKPTNEGAPDGSTVAEPLPTDSHSTGLSDPQPRHHSTLADEVPDNARPAPAATPTDPTDIATQATPPPVLEGGEAVAKEAEHPQAQGPEDHPMEDAPAPSKSGRAREEDDPQNIPAAKRAKTEEGVNEDFKIPDRPQIDTSMNTEAALIPSEPRPMTKPRQKHIVKVVANVKRINAAKPFLLPVDPVALNIPSYLDVIKSPMDLKTLEDNLRAERYTTIDALEADFNQIVQNAVTFNGSEHQVTKFAFAMQENFTRNLETGLPSVDTPETASKKKAPDPMAIRAPPVRRESRSSVPGSARSPASATSPQTFALGPEGVPLIRRDSTIDGRPKREIHRPAPKDLPYTNQKPKKKKYQWELKFCDHVLKEVSKPKYQQFSLPFLSPVDPVALNIPNYLSIIKKPMDFGTMKQRLERGEYENAKEFENDARLVFKNCYLFNPENDPVNTMGKRLEGIFNEEWSKKRDWLDENVPSSGQRSPASSDDEASEEEEEEEEEEEDAGQMEIVSKLQKQIAEMSKQVEMITSGAKKKTPPAANKKAKPVKAVKKEPKKSAPVQPKAEKKAAPKQAKKEKAPYVTYEQKTEISSRISDLSASKMTQALAIIRQNMPDLSEANDDELELDIDAIPNDVLYKLLIFVRKHAPKSDDPSLPPSATASSAAPPRKKNKPMSKHEQEARIAQVQSGLSAFQKGGAGNSPQDVRPSIEDQSDEDDDEDSESEEE